MFFIVHVAQVVILLIVSPSSAIQRILSPHLHLWGAIIFLMEKARKGEYILFPAFAHLHFPEEAGNGS